MACFDCPRECGEGHFCGKSDKGVRIAKVMRHFFEEPIICPQNKGCGAIFFSHCSLKCAYCQNYEISHLGSGNDFSIAELAQVFEKLDKSGVENIDLVTPTHQMSNILSAISLYKPKVPIIWNTSGYEREENIQKLSGIVDIFLFDFKYFDSDLSTRLSKAPRYFETCLKALKKAREIIPKDEFRDGIMKKGIIIRHLILPNHTDDSIKIFEEIKRTIGTDVFVSIMSQYSPYYKARDFEDINRTLKPLEAKKVQVAIKKMGFNKGFVQDLSSNSKCYTPSFDLDKFWEV